MFTGEFLLQYGLAQPGVTPENWLDKQKPSVWDNDDVLCNMRSYIITVIMSRVFFFWYSAVVAGQ